MHPPLPLPLPADPARARRAAALDAIAAASPRRAPRVARVIAAALLVGLAGSACGSSAGAVPPSDAATATDPAATEAPAETSTATGPGADGRSTTSVEVGGEAWFAGFHVTFGTATAEIEPGRGGTVSIDAAFENTGDEDATLDATLDLAYGGEHARDAFGMDIPRVPGGSSASGTLAFDVEDTFAFETSVLTLGRSSNQQAVVPLTPAAGEAVTREPVAIEATGSGTAGDLRLDLLGGELRADQPWSHGQMAAGTLVLTLAYDATFESDFAGGFAFAGENVALRLPDGTVVGVIQDGRSQSIELIGPQSTVKDLLSRFEVEEPASGDYALLVRSFEDAVDEIPFSIP